MSAEADADVAGPEGENVILIVDENVKLFYIGKDNVITAPTDPSFLRAVVNESKYRILEVVTCYLLII